MFIHDFNSIVSSFNIVLRYSYAFKLITLNIFLFQNSGDIYEQLWQLIVRLNANSQRYIHLLQDVYHKEDIHLSVEQWIDQSVISQCLSQQLSCADYNQDLLQQYYHCKNCFLFWLFILCCFEINISPRRRFSKQKKNIYIYMYRFV